MGAPASTPGQIPNYTPGVDYVGSQNHSPPLPGSTPSLYCDYVKCIRLSESTTLPEYTPSSQNLPLLPRIYPPFQQLYATPPESTPPSQNIPHFQCQLYATLPQSTPPSQNIPPFSTTICDPPRIYSSLPEYTPIFNNYKIMRPFQNLPLPPRMFFSSGSKWSILSQLQKRLEKVAYSVTEGYVLGISHIVVER